ncbi:MAG: Peptidase U61 LD-carboxypeptidase A [Candidatus Roizmanbacteria bacterium GW2011_GWB1_40_7]|uniref:Peptidase U61 LD-carboxypeptidase A n=2 Tax=Candidatus Roizmaniibacteriota TaxID=1752723 RepID=A0A0G0WAJ1_9BACT|nr:MAG: Peptidase U61 LD-carboxypeptidase A [Candidatus Roizmanbacteria bacterium GW2011_GWB1_40_7]KKR95083.1 MAG: Peptidase U61 LD-carboxypeptidase A [Candidatus Roizmanbacteria bacterium GW2011_GWA1_41_13]
MIKLNKLKKGDKVAILSPSFAAPGRWPHVYELGLKRLREVYELEPVEFPTTKKVGASAEERAKDLIDAFGNIEVKAVISSLGGDDQITYIKNLPKEPFVNSPKPFFGYSDNTHFESFLWLNGIPSFYGGSLFVQFAEQGKMNEFTVKYLKYALFDEGEIELEASKEYNDIGLDWENPDNLSKNRLYEPNVGWIWNGNQNAEGITWGGCVESIDELLRHGVTIPTLDEFESIILLTETSEEIPSADYVRRVYRALGERGILKRIKGLLVGRPKAWEFDKQNSTEQKEDYRRQQRETILEIVRKYNSTIPIIQNLDFGHSDPQVPMPYGSKVRIDTQNKKIFANF